MASYGGWRMGDKTENQQEAQEASWYCHVTHFKLVCTLNLKYQENCSEVIARSMVYAAHNQAIHCACVSESFRFDFIVFQMYMISV